MYCQQKRLCPGMIIEKKQNRIVLTLLNRLLIAAPCKFRLGRTPCIFQRTCSPNPYGFRGCIEFIIDNVVLLYSYSIVLYRSRAVRSARRQLRRSGDIMEYVYFFEFERMILLRNNVFDETCLTRVSNGISIQREYF